MAKARFLAAERSQLRWDMVDLESALPLDHQARVVWAFVEALDLSELYAGIRAVEGSAGRPPADPKILLAVWLYATLEGVGAARQVDELCKRHAAYRWLCGGVPMNYHSLSDFRVGHADFLDRLLSQSVTALIAQGLVSLEEVAIDGTKAKAAAGKGSFRTGAKLAALEAAVGEHVRALRTEVSADPAAGRRRSQAARERAAEDTARRVAQAREIMEKLLQEKAERAKKHKKAEAAKGEPRVSVTDPETRIMRFSDGAFRPAYNMQIAAATNSAVIVAVAATDRRNDSGMAVPMVDQIHTRYGQRPSRVLADSTYVMREDIPVLAAAGVTVYTPLPEEKEADAIKPESARKRAQARDKEPPPVKEWRERMAGEAGRQTYKRRSRIETVNGCLKNRGLGVVRVRSMLKARCILLLHALAHNLWRGHVLRASRAPA